MPPEPLLSNRGHTSGGRGLLTSLSRGAVRLLSMRSAPMARMAGQICVSLGTDMVRGIENRVKREC